ncbi:hypothetical protein RF11_14269 [Thelohanellus kitauei]|uniref:Vacuolar protein sorting/targeting protein 10 n=1 Tax=Thelohanellus kitauei TaxID=669202 RepID=A0A0C2MMS7_THEKT|nr:hypothetical protein RF11_14269 [Thelohanellus kitauei]
MLIIMATIGNQKELKILDITTNTLDAAVFPAFLIKKKVKHFDLEFGTYYIILVDIEHRTCLWGSSFPPYHFVRKACYDSNTSDEIILNFYMNKNLEGVLLMNHPADNNVMMTYKSTNKGRFWFKNKFVFPCQSQLKKSVYFDFQLHDHQTVPKNFQWIDIQYEHEDTGIQPFITLDGGNSWNATPKTKSKVVMLPYGSVILFVDMDSNGINYSLDQTATWLRFDLYKTKPNILYIGRISETDLKAVIVTREPEVDKLQFTTVDFSHIFTTHYHQWPLPKAEGYCYRGKNTLMRTRDPKILCIDKLTEHMETKSICPCTSDDYKNVFISQLLLDGAHLRRQSYTKVDIPAEINVNSPITFDHTRKYIYTSMGKYITQFTYIGTVHSKLYFVNDNIIDLAYDSVFRVLIFLTSRKQLKTPVCTKHTSDIGQFYIDFTTQKAYILTISKDLIILNFTEGITLYTITHVSDFAVFGEHMYFIDGGKLMFRNVSKKSTNV